MLPIVVGACAGLDYAHRKGVVHRDVKPGNLLRGVDRVIKLADFGIAKATEQSSITQVGSVLGTAAYLAPEQGRGEDAGPPADIYALGVVAYQLLSGRLPFEGASLTELAIRQQREPPARLDALVATVTPELASAIGIALRINPRERYPTAAEMARALEEGARGIAPGSGHGRRSALPQRRDDRDRRRRSHAPHRPRRERRRPDPRGRGEPHARRRGRARRRRRRAAPAAAGEPRRAAPPAKRAAPAGRVATIVIGIVVIVAAIVAIMLSLQPSTTVHLQGRLHRRHDVDRQPALDGDLQQPPEVVIAAPPRGGGAAAVPEGSRALRVTRRAAARPRPRRDGRRDRRAQPRHHAGDEGEVVEGQQAAPVSSRERARKCR